MKSETQGEHNLQNVQTKSNSIKTDSDLEFGTNPQEQRSNNSQED